MSAKFNQCPNCGSTDKRDAGYAKGKRPRPLPTVFIC